MKIIAVVAAAWDGGLFPANSPRIVWMGDSNVPKAALPLSDKVLGTIAKMISDRMDYRNSRQPATIQIITPDKREIARWIVDDITEIQEFNLYNAKLFRGRL
ncbi:hypothetical protein ACE38V_08160 [Cytobacillus sp. Hz8]|uniref:hypothetical protein n=1 Tax=Cytobacillus sp. Hz8 TaxID=3347168 RepID=UPI0035D62CD0